FIIVDPPAQVLVETTPPIEEKITWDDPLTPPFDVKEDLANLFIDLEDAKATAIILKQKDKQGVTAKWHPYHITVDNHINKRYLFLNRIVKESTIDRPKIGFTQPLDIPIIDRDHEITEDSKITVMSVNREVAWYYRDLFTYKFGAGSAEYNYLIMIDGKIVSIRGYAPIGLSKDGAMLEIYGIVYNNTKYRHLGRLITRLITSHEFIDVINTSLFPVLTLKTTKFKFFKEDRELKGLDYEVYESTEVKDAPGKFKIKYQAKIKDTSYKDMIKDWLQEEANHGKPQRVRKRKPRSNNRPK
ncbi:hypothetical protein KA005_05090, partial [bacterium]|nr:hypothetical protein [bacterium]